jgi:hypothetical protein
LWLKLSQQSCCAFPTKSCCVFSTQAKWPFPSKGYCALCMYSMYSDIIYICWGLRLFTDWSLAVQENKKKGKKSFLQLCFGIYKISLLCCTFDNVIRLHCECNLFLHKFIDCIILCSLFLLWQIFFAIWPRSTSLRCTSLEIKGTSTLHSLCSTFTSTVDCTEDVGVVLSAQWCRDRTWLPCLAIHPPLETDFWRI